MRRLQLILMSTAMIGIAFCSTDLFAWHGGHYRYYGGNYYSSGMFGFGRVVVRPPCGAFFIGLPYGYTTVVIGGMPYYYYDNVYYQAYQGGYVVVEAPPAQTIVVPGQATPTATQQTTTPGIVQVQTINAKGLPAAKIKDSTATGISLQKGTAELPDSVTTINIPNSKGNYTAVKLIKKNNGYIGPQGEFYGEHPTVAQLKALYGN